MIPAEIERMAQDDIPAALGAVQLAVVSPETNLSELAEIALQGARMAAQLGDWLTCRRLADRGRQAAIESDAGPDLLGCLAAAQGAAAVHQGDTRAAIEYLTEALAIAAHSPAVAARRCRILHNLAVAKSQWGWSVEAITHYDQAAVEFEEQGLGQMALQARLGAVWVLVQAKVPGGAKARLQAAENGLADYPEMRASWLLYAAHVEALEGRSAEARELAAPLTKVANSGVAAEAMLLLGNLALAEGEHMEALRLSKEAMKLALKDGYVSLVNRIQRLKKEAGGGK